MLENDASALKFSKQISTARSLNLCELQIVLSDQQARTVRRKPQAANLIAQAQESCVRFAQIRSRQAVMDTRETLETADLHHFEIAQLINLLPRSAEETKSLIPSLRRYTDNKLEEKLDALEAFRFAAG